MSRRTEIENSPEDINREFQEIMETDLTEFDEYEREDLGDVINDIDRQIELQVLNHTD